VGLSLSPSTILGSASSVAAVGSSSPAPKALGCSSVEFSVSSVRACSSPPKFSSPASVVEKFSTAVPQQVALGCSSVAISAFSAAKLLYPPPVDMGFSMGCSPSIGLAPSVHWNSFLPGGVVFGILEWV
jgi:hypothetical protein